MHSGATYCIKEGLSYTSPKYDVTYMWRCGWVGAPSGLSSRVSTFASYIPSQIVFYRRENHTSRAVEMEGGGGAGGGGV